MLQFAIRSVRRAAPSSCLRVRGRRGAGRALIGMWSNYPSAPLSARERGLPGPAARAVGRKVAQRKRRGAFTWPFVFVLSLGSFVSEMPRVGHYLLQRSFVLKWIVLEIGSLEIFCFFPRSVSLILITCWSNVLCWHPCEARKTLLKRFSRRMYYRIFSE